ncbi:hypothetical protein JHK87_041895 [Glycine soja]|nr:hypothetical protein JHK87_041895 [Glycine soja]
MTPGLVKRLTKSLSATLGFRSSSSVAKVTTGTDLLSIAHNVSLQKALTWDEGGAFTGVCSEERVPTYMDNNDKFKAKGIHAVIRVSINDPLL